MTLLLLFDIDGTLLQRASVEHARALREAAGEVHGVDLLSIDGVEYAVVRAPPNVISSCVTATAYTSPGAPPDDATSRAASSAT